MKRKKERKKEIRESDQLVASQEKFSFRDHTYAHTILHKLSVS